MMFTRYGVFTIGLLLAGCGTGSNVQPEPIERLYVPVDLAAENAQASTDRCVAIATELETLDAQLGGPAIDHPPEQPPSGGKRFLYYWRDLVVETVKGPIQPLIQTGKALTNYEGKKAAQAQAVSRAEMRRAYLLGARDGATCQGGG